jgi:hypothetical protein
MAITFELLSITSEAHLRLSGRSTGNVVLLPKGGYRQNLHQGRHCAPFWGSSAAGWDYADFREHTLAGVG